MGALVLETCRSSSSAIKEASSGFNSIKSRHRSDCALSIYGYIIKYCLILWYIIVYHLVLYYILWFVGPNSNLGFDLEPGSSLLGSMCLF